MTAIIEARGLSKRYRSRWALTDGTLSIPAARSNLATRAASAALAASSSATRAARPALCAASTAISASRAASSGLAVTDHHHPGILMSFSINATRWADAKKRR
jgi:hypothetical protein